MRLSTWKSVSLLLLAPRNVISQSGPSSNVAQCIPQYDWSISASGQTPCLLAAFLESACGTNTSVNTLPIGQMYQGPLSSEQSPCKCSSVTYIMMSACAGCQDRNFVNWTTWCGHCDQLFREVFPKPLPDFIDIPPWAFMNVTTEGAFNPDLAQQIALNSSAVSASSGSIGSPTSSNSAGISTSSPAMSTSAAASGAAAGSPSSAPAITSKSHTNVGPIVGGVIGGIAFGIAAVILAWFFCCRRKKQTEEQVETKQQVLDPSFEIVNPFVGSPVTETFSSSPTSSPQALLFDHERIAANAPNRSPRKFNRSRGTITRPVDDTGFEKYEAPPQYAS